MTPSRRNSAARTTVAVAATAVACLAAVVGPVGTAGPAGATGAAPPTGSFSTLTAGQSVTSPHGRFRFTMQTDGNAVLRRSDNVLAFATYTQGHPGAYIVQQLDGNLVVYSAQHEALWWNGVRTASPIRATVADYGAVVTSDGHQTWSSGPVDVLPNASPGYPVTADAGKIRLLAQADGNLVEYVSGRAVWSSGTVHPTGSYPELINQSDGNTVLIAFRHVNGTTTAYPTWSTRTAGHPGAVFSIQADTNLVVRSATGQVLWHR